MCQRLHIFIPRKIPLGLITHSAEYTNLVSLFRKHVYLNLIRNEKHFVLGTIQEVNGDQILTKDNRNDDAVKKWNKIEIVFFLVFDLNAPLHTFEVTLLWKSLYNVLVFAKPSIFLSVENAIMRMLAK